LGFEDKSTGQDETHPTHKSARKFDGIRQQNERRGLVGRTNFDLSTIADGARGTDMGFSMKSRVFGCAHYRRSRPRLGSTPGRHFQAVAPFLQLEGMSLQYHETPAEGPSAQKVPRRGFNTMASMY
jgi:hypothetical protein